MHELKVVAVCLMFLLAGMPLAIQPEDADPDPATTHYTLYGEDDSDGLVYYTEKVTDYGESEDYENGKVVFSGVVVRENVTVILYDSNWTEVWSEKNFMPDPGTVFNFRYQIDVADLGVYHVHMIGSVSKSIRSWTLDVQAHCTVSFDTGDGHKVKSLFIPLGDTVVLPGATHPVKDVSGTISGYTFLGWYDSSEEGASLIGMPDEETGMILTDTTYYGKWHDDSEDETYRVKYSATYIL